MKNITVEMVAQYIDEIKDKIVYVKDKDLLGYDSSNSLAFQFRYWKMKKFGISDNFIAMDDDYFIGGSLKKTDFFYVENGKVVPAIISPNFLRKSFRSSDKHRIAIISEATVISNPSSLGTNLFSPDKPVSTCLNCLSFKSKHLFHVTFFILSSFPK